MASVSPTRVLALGALGLLGFLYWKPLKTYFHTKHELQLARSAIDALSVEQKRLQQRIAAVASTPELIRESRRLGLVKPGERLFIVKGIPAWRREHRRSERPG